MAKDPAFLFYSSDFLVGTLDMTMEERGQYITILATMHQKGRLSEKTIRFLVGSLSDNLKQRFRIDEDGLWFNERLELEIQKRARFTESRRSNGLKGGRPRKDKKPSAKPKQNHMEDEDEDENVNVNNKIVFRSKKFGKAWDEWKQYKADQFGDRYKSIKSEKAVLAKLKNITAGDDEHAIQILQHAMANNWRGFWHREKQYPAHVMPKTKVNEMSVDYSHPRTGPMKISDIKMNIKHQS